MIDPSRKEESKEESLEDELKKISDEKEVEEWLISKEWRIVNCRDPKGVPFKMWTKDNKKYFTRIRALRKEVKAIQGRKSKNNGQVSSK